jgi:hypothetical protein
MAWRCGGGTDRLAWTPAIAPANKGCLSFKFRTTETTLNCGLLVHWSSSSRNGWGVLLNSAAVGDGTGKIRFVAYAASAQRVDAESSTVTLNDGNWHHVGINFDREISGNNELFIDSVSEDSGASAGDWSTVTQYSIVAGDGVDGFWPTPVVEIAEFGYWSWSGFTPLTQQEFAALSKGYSPHRIRPHMLRHHMPLVRDLKDRRFNGTLTEGHVGGTIVAHPRVIGGLI